MDLNQGEQGCSLSYSLSTNGAKKWYLRQESNLQNLASKASMYTVPSLRLKMSAGVGFEPTTNGAALGADELPSITPRESE